MNLNAIHNIYLVGIGGAGMSALARYFLLTGKRVAGYDRTESDVTKQLEAAGAYIVFDEDKCLIPENFRKSAETLVIYTPAVPDNHQQLRFFRSAGHQVVKRAECLGYITRSHRTAAIAGTHGKTTTTTMLAHILHQSAGDFAAFLGGISVNHNTNFVSSNDEQLQQHGGLPANAWLAVEADEYDRSFLQLRPMIAVVTSVDADHLDIYGTEENYRAIFADFSACVQQGGYVIRNVKANFETRVQRDVQVLTYGAHEGYFTTKNLTNNNGMYCFDLVYEQETVITSLQLAVAGLHNVENALAAAASALLIGVEPQHIKDALQSFGGVKRRMEFYANTPTRVYVDDYAHHPDEIEATLKALRGMFPQRHITAVFQPHLYSRTRDFADGFGASLSLADSVLLLPVYPARELPIEGVNSQLILDKICIDSKKLCEKGTVIDILQQTNFDVLVTMGAGDIDKVAQTIAITFF